MIFADTYDKLTFIIILCSSIFNSIFAISMNKRASLFKLLGSVFIIPFFICSYAFVFSPNIQADLIVSLAEFCLSAGIMLILLHPYSVKNHNLKAAAIALISLVTAIYSMKSELLIYYGLPLNIRNGLIAVFITVSVVQVLKIKYDQKLIVPLSVWLVGTLLGFFGNHDHIGSLKLIIKISAFIAFMYFFYSTTYKAFMDKINESEKLKESIEHSLNREVRKRVFEIERSHERLLEMSKTDLLTKAYNKFTILNLIEKLINSKKCEVFTILMFDIDNFKTINDSLGHVTGDMCLKTLANIASGNIREVDYIGRYGGDEFIIVLPNLGFNEGKFVAERFKSKVNETSDPKFTVSIGIATYPNDGKTVKELISAADKGLYESKSRGKNAISHVSTI